MVGAPYPECVQMEVHPMKRDIDLCRQLLFDLEASGAESAVNVLRSRLSKEADDRVRYHLRLLVDAGLAKEVERKTNGVASIRLTNAGSDFIELCRSDARWRDAKTLVLERTGGLSLAVLRSVLIKWAVESVSHGYVRRPRRAYRPFLRRSDTQLRYDDYRADNELVDVDDDLELLRTAPDYRERPDWHDRMYEPGYYHYNGHRYETDSLEPNIGVQLPIYLV